MKKKWTELELTIVYYTVKHGVHGAIRNRETGKFLNEREVCSFLGHGAVSYTTVRSSFKHALGIPVANIKYFKSTKSQKAIVEKYANTTVSQLRLVIQRGLDELKLKSNDNILENDKSSPERLKIAPGHQYGINFDDAS